MNDQFSISRILLYCSILTFVVTPAFADSACDTEIAAIQAAIDAPAEGVSSDNFGQAVQLFKVLKEDCNGGTSFSVVAPVAQQIRSLLGMGDAS